MHPPAPLDFLLPSTHPTYGIDRRKDITLPHLQQLTPIYFEAPVKNGLRTPPADEMTTYQHPQYNGYGSRHDATYSGGSSTGSHSGGYSSASTQPRSYYSSISQSSQESVPSLRGGTESSAVVHSRPQSPQQGSRTSTLAPPESQPRRKSADMIRPNLQIPRKISDSGGSLGEFAAQITCLFWFESTETLLKIEGQRQSSSPIQRFRDEALPSTGFRKWVVTVLSTTQVTENVIILALLFIYRLKKINPQVKGRSGSEYRLLTVALMLGNKFLDDNTYTNKTWAEVSGISVSEIHVMEVEFLSNMRYSLLASKEEWEDWHSTLRKYYDYCELASKAPSQHIEIPSPISMQNSPPSLSLSYPASNLASGYLNNNTPQWSPNTAALSSSMATPLPHIPALDTHMYARKRSYDGEAEEPAAKRVTRSMGPASYGPTIPPLRLDVPRLPVPNLTISTSQPMYTHNSSGNISQNAPLLPPLNGRSMSTVYPTTPINWPPQLPMLTPTGPHNTSGHSTPSRRQSPHSVHDLLAYGSSPISANFPGQSQGHISPSLFLQQRSSPYKPIRHVNTLLYSQQPPTSMHDWSLNANQMHYQPLGKRDVYRSGVVPEYTYSQHQHQQFPVLPQPNFHA